MGGRALIHYGCVAGSRPRVGNKRNIKCNHRLGDLDRQRGSHNPIEAYAVTDGRRKRLSEYARGLEVGIHGEEAVNIRWNNSSLMGATHCHYGRFPWRANV